MNAPVDLPLNTVTVTTAITQACDRIAPTWPLDQFIAVNPYWGWVNQPMPQAAAALEALGGTRLTMPRSWFAAQWQAGHLQRQHLNAAARRAAGDAASADSVAQEVDALVAALQTPDAQLAAVERFLEQCARASAREPADGAVNPALGAANDRQFRRSMPG